MKYLIIFLISFSCYSEDFVKLNKAYIEITKSVGTNRHWSIPEGESKSGDLNFFTETIYFNFIYARSMVNSFYTDSQFRYVSLTEEIAVKPFKQLELFYQHRSEHGLDYEYLNIDKYPNTNSVGIRINLLGGKE